MKLFKLIKKSTKSQARLGILTTSRGKIQTPFFMPIATRGSVKSLTSEDIKKLGAQIVLGNTYHLYLKPGLKVLKKAKGLHQFMNWQGPILTDSGGFQVFSLDAKTQKREDAKARNKNLVKVTNKGVEFRSVYDGSKHLFTPSSVIKTQQIFGSDIMMVLDQCVANPCSYEKAKEAMERTLKWAEQSFKIQDSSFQGRSKLFGIVQGSLYKDLRIKCAQELSKMNFSVKGGPVSGWDGYAVGGLAVGEDPKEMYQVLDYTVPELPEDKPHYLMGVGYPEQIIESVKRGIDMFDCVIPTREARHGRLYVRNPKFQIPNNKFYSTINIKAEKFSKDISPINPNSKLPELREYSKSYLRHLFNVNESLALRLATLNNLEFYLSLMSEIRLAIKDDKL